MHILVNGVVGVDTLEGPRGVVAVNPAIVSACDLLRLTMVLYMRKSMGPIRPVETLELNLRCVISRRQSHVYTRDHGAVLRVAGHAFAFSVFNHIADP